MSLSDRAAAAQAIAELGWRVVLCHGVTDDKKCTCPRGADCPTPGKHPRLTAWQTEATTDAEVIANYFAMYASSNVGVLLGTVLVDVEADDDASNALATELLGKIETPAYASSRSVHRLFQPPVNAPATAVAKHRGIELRLGRSKAAQSILPPSQHHSGAVYRWLDGLSPWQVPLAPFPAELLADAPPTSTSEFVMGVGEFGDHPGAGEGDRHRTLCKLVGTHLATYGADANLVARALEWAQKCRPPLPEEEVLQVVGKLASKHQGGQTATPKQPPAMRWAARRYATIEPEEVTWLWPHRIAVGKLTLIAGEPGLGKTFLACDLCARISRGGAFPDGAASSLGECAILTCEDDAGDTLRPRLDRHDANVDRVHHFDWVDIGGKEHMPDLGKHLEGLRSWLIDNPNVRLIVIDPISAFLGGVDSHKNAEVRSVLGPLSVVAAEHQVAVLGITHMSKAQGASSMNKVIGSIAFIAAARAAWRLGADPDDEGRRLLLPLKNNLSNAAGLAFRIVDGRIEWEKGDVMLHADDLDAAEETPREEARAWLEGILSAGAVEATKIIKAARADGVSEKTLRRAKKELKVMSRRIGDAWFWSLPNGDSGNRSDGTFTF